MPKLPVLKAKQILKFLANYGFSVVGQTGSHMKLKDNRGAIVIVPIHSSKDIPKGTLLSILRQAGLTKEQLIEFF